MNYISDFGLALALLSLIGLGASGLGASGLGYRWGLWSYRIGISIVKCAGFTSVVAVVACLIGVVLWNRNIVTEGMTPAMVGLILGGGVLAVTLKWKRNLDSLSYIHDITTDTENPPRFMAIFPLRASAENPADYGGPELARQQWAAYPDLKPISLETSPLSVFEQALQAAKDMGWKIVDSSPQSLRIEATDTTLWFGFQDDVVVRITPAPTGSRVDVRSVSRAGKSDVGTNARRIETYLARIVQA